MRSADSGIQIAWDLQDATPLVVPFQILSGWRLEEIAASLPSSGIEISPEEFLSAASNAAALQLPSDFQLSGSLEGYLFPGSYDVERTITSSDLLSRFTGRFSEELSPQIKEGFSKQGLSLSQGVILASIIEKEGVIPAERPLIASVFLKPHGPGHENWRVTPTVQYAVGFNEKDQSWWKNPLTYSDLEVDSPYNTYRYEGLPPGPDL